MTAPSPRLALRRVGFVAVVVGAVLVVVVAIVVLVRTSRAQQTIAEHAARVSKEGMDFAALRRGRPPILEPAASTDTASVVRAFHDALDAVPGPNLRTVNAYPDRPAAEVQPILDAHPEVVAALEPSLRSRSVAERCEVRMASWEAERWLAAVASAALARGDARAAAETALLGLGYGHEFGGCGGGFHVSRSGLEIQVWAAKILAEALARGIGAPQARRIRLVLERLEFARTPRSTVLAGYRLVMRAGLVDPESGRQLRESPNDRHWLGPGDLFSWTVYRARALEVLDVAVDAMSRIAATAEADARAAVGSAEAFEPGHTFFEDGETWFADWIQWREEARAWSVVVSTACAAIEHAEKHGALASSLADLVPEYLPSIPIDPWSGSALRWSSTGVASAGPYGLFTIEVNFPKR